MDIKGKVNREWVKQTIKYWEDFKIKCNVEDRNIDQIIKELSADENATIEDAYKLWREINRLWLLNQKVLDRNEVNAFLKETEGFDPEKLKEVNEQEIALIEKKAHQGNETADRDTEEKKTRELVREVLEEIKREQERKEEEETELRVYWRWKRAWIGKKSEG